MGLALSMSVGVILLARLKANHDADHFHPKLDQIVRIFTVETSNNKQTKWATAPLPLANAIGSTAFVEKTVKVRLGGMHNVQTDNGDIPVDLAYSEPSFFDVFGFKLLAGNPQSLSNDPNALFLSEKTATKIFGDRPAVGQVLRLENAGTFTVSGIIQDPLLETHLPIEAMCSIHAAEVLEKRGMVENLSDNWSAFKHTALYARMAHENNLAQLNQVLQNHRQKLEKSDLQFFAQPLDDITPANGEFVNDFHTGISSMGIKVLLFLIFSLTLLSAFNYISLSMARAFARARETGIRKTIGATRSQIIKQFLMEATLIAFFALLCTVPLVQILMYEIPHIEVKLRFDGLLVAVLAVYTILTGLISGALPAWLLSAFQPVQILRKMKTVKLFRGVAIYKVLIVAQFSVSTMLMVFFVILTDFERKNSATIQSVLPDNVLTLDLKGENYEALQQEINQLGQVETTLATNWYYDAYKQGRCVVSMADKTLKVNYVSIDPKTIETEGIRLESGQNFPSNLPKTIEQYVLVNEAAAKLFGFTAATMVGQRLSLDNIPVQVLGIMPNQVIGMPMPLVFRYLPKEITHLTIKTLPNSELAVTKACEAIWKNKFPEKTANIHNLKALYSGDTARERLGFFGFFALLVMIIASMGILGIASYSVELRTKELGIRKVMGATKGNLVFTSTKKFGVLIFIAGLVGIPAGLFCGYYLRKIVGSQVDLSILNVSIGFGSVFMVGLLTVLSQTIRAGQVDPVKILSAE